MQKIKDIFTGPSKDSMLLMFVRIVTMGLGLCISRILSQALSLQAYGTYSQIMLLVSTIASITICGMADGCNFYFYNNKGLKEREEYISTIFAWQYIMGIVAGTVLLCCSLQISSYFRNPALKRLLLFAAVLPMTQNIISMLQVLFVAIGRAKDIAVRNLIISVSRLILFTLASCIFESVNAVLSFSLIMDLLQIVYFRVTLKREHCPCSLKNVNFRLAGKIFSFCIPMAAFIVLSSLSRDCDRYVISAFTDTDTMAVYTNAAKMLPFDIITVSYGTVLVPYITRYISQKNFEKAQDIYRMFLEISFSTTAVLATAAAVGAPMLMELLYSEKYMSGLAVFTVYIFTDIFRTLNITLVLSAAGKGKVLLAISAGSLLGNLVLNIIFFKTMGIVGPAVSTLIITAITGIIIQKKCAETLNCNIHELFDWKYITKLIVELLGFGIVFHLISNALAYTGIHYFVRLIIVSGSYGIILIALNCKRFLKCVGEIGKYKLTT